MPDQHQLKENDMVFAGKGILISSMEVRPEEEADFNEWFDREHLAERVAIPGFLEARRYESVGAPTRYLQIYNTTGFDVLNSAAYRAALAKQTEWSNHHISRFIAPTRTVGRLARSAGVARGVAVVLLRLRPSGDPAMMPALADVLDVLEQPGTASIHFVEADAKLSRPVTADSGYVGAEDCYVVVECTSEAAGGQIVAQLEMPVQKYGELIDARIFRYRMDISALALAAQ
ncbi:antibiotic biosynthesis monooxygenase family protein [Variovorax sp. LARHSF232]